MVRISDFIHSAQKENETDSCIEDSASSKSKDKEELYEQLLMDEELQFIIDNFQFTQDTAPEVSAENIRNSF